MVSLYERLRRGIDACVSPVWHLWTPNLGLVSVYRWRKLARRLSPAVAPRVDQIKLRAPCSRRMLVTLELVATSSPREISLASSSGPNTFASSVKREFFFRDWRSPPLSTNSQRPSIRTKVRIMGLLTTFSVASSLLFCFSNTYN